MCLYVDKNKTKEFFAKHTNPDQVLRAWKLFHPWNNKVASSIRTHYFWHSGENKPEGKALTPHLSRSRMRKGAICQGALHAYVKRSVAKERAYHRGLGCITFRVKDVIALGQNGDIAVTRCNLSSKTYRKLLPKRKK